MIRKFIILSGIIATISFLTYGADDKSKAKEKQWAEYPMTYSDDWKILKDIVTANPQIVDISNNYVPLPNPKDKDKKGYRCGAGGKTASLDTDGDGKLDKELKDKENFIDYRVDYDNNGPALPYRLRVWQRAIRKVGKDEWPTWAFQRACCMQGKTPIETFTLIDDNNNGYYDDYGEDAVVIGSSKQAEALSSVIAVKGKLYEFKVDMTGAKISLKEYTGPVGKIDVFKGFNMPNQKPERVVIAGDNDTYFNVPLQSKMFILPAGEYRLWLASINKRIKVRAGPDATFVKVEESDPKQDKDKLVVLKWGAPFKLLPEPKSERGGTLVKIIPPAQLVAPKRESTPLEFPFIKMDLPKIIGAAGEEYYAPPEFKGEYDVGALPDPSIIEFKVEISDKEHKDAKPLNKIGNPLVDNWIQVDMSGLVVKSPPWWEKYQCPMYNFRGTVVLKMSAKSSIFGELKFEGEVEVEEK